MKHSPYAILIALSFCVNFAFAQERIDIDKRNRSEIVQYYLVFAARTSGEGSIGKIPGHAFVIWGKEDWKRQMSTQETFGFYPVEGKKGVTGPVPGRIVDEVTKRNLSRVTILVSVRVNSDSYQSALKVRDKWKNKNYVLTKSDCVTFVTEVAKIANLKLPSRSTNLLPQDYIEELMKLL